MSTPSSAHPITVEPLGKRVVVRFAGQVIADSMNALGLKEGSMQPVVYVPRADAAMDKLTPTSNRTHCPFKGDASYFSIQAEGKTAENAVWSYEQPKDAVAAIKGHLAFYPNRVDAIEVG